MAKRGRMTSEEQQFIRDNAYKLTADEIAHQIDRTTEMVEEFIKMKVPPPQAVAQPKADETEKVVIRQELRNSETWKNLKGEFTSEELKYFEEGYIKLMSQFKGDGEVKASEETQVFQAIKFEILMSRNLKERRRCRDDITRLEKTQEEFLAKFKGNPSKMTDKERDYTINLESQLTAARAGEQSRTNEYVKLQERHDALMRSMKSTRDQRLKEIQSSKVSFLSVIKMLMERDIQERESRQMELMKMAGNKEYVRLGRPMKYDDENEDSPILSADTVDLGPEETVESLEEDE